MKIMDIKAAMSETSYPGRGILLGKSADGDHAVIVYFIMGRSSNSRNRIFTQDGEGIRTEAYDPSKLQDPSLIIYSPVRVLDGDTIVTNGDQTDTIHGYLMMDKSFEDALRTRTFEPDAPNFTPRISGIINRDGNTFSYKLSILKSANGNDTSCQRFFYEYNTPVNGLGHFIHTYRCDGNPIPSFDGEPENVALGNDIDSITDDIWTSLDNDNKVSLFVRFIDLNSGKYETRIINKNN